jgi:hypothetical protein
MTGNITSGTDIEGVFAAIDNYCAGHPLDPIYGAATMVGSDLSHRLLQDQLDRNQQDISDQIATGLQTSRQVRVAPFADYALVAGVPQRIRGTTFSTKPIASCNSAGSVGRGYFTGSGACL